MELHASHPLFSTLAHKRVRQPLSKEGLASTGRTLQDNVLLPLKLRHDAREFGFVKEHAFVKHGVDGVRFARRSFRRWLAIET